MMILIEFKRAYGDFSPGDQAVVCSKQAYSLLSMGIAEPLEKGDKINKAIMIDGTEQLFKR